MFENAESIDLSALAQPSVEGGSSKPPKTRWIWRFIPIAVVLGFTAVFAETLVGVFKKTIAVTVVRPQAIETTSESAKGALVQSAGWIEADPFPTRVTALADGVVEHMLKQESDEVQVGDIIAELIKDDAQIALELAEASHEEAISDLDAASVERRNAQASYDAGLEVQESLSTAQAEFESRVAEQALRDAAVDRGRAALKTAQHELEVQRYLKQNDASGPWQVELAESNLHQQESGLAVLEAEAVLSKAQIKVSQSKLTRAERDMELRLDERLRLETAGASLKKSQALLDRAAASVKEALLRLERMTVLSPVSGIVLHYHVYPGSPVGPSMNSEAICHLYDPSNLRVRVDVPQSQVGKIAVGQPAEIRCDVRRNQLYRGEVTRIVESADIQKVTLEAQVHIQDPDRFLKPEMLCQVTFFGKADNEGPAESRVAVSIPEACLSGDSVWVIDASSGKASRRSVQAGKREFGRVIILEGLNLSDKVISKSAKELHDGDAVEVTLSTAEGEGV